METARRIVISLLPTLPTTLNRLLLRSSRVHELTGTTFVPLWSQFIIRSAEMARSWTKSPMRSRNDVSCSSKFSGSFLAAFVALRFTKRCRFRNKSAQSFVRVMLSPFSLGRLGFFVRQDAFSCRHDNAGTDTATSLTQRRDVLSHLLIQITQ